MMFGHVPEGGQSQEPVLVVCDSCGSKREGRTWRSDKVLATS